MATILVRGGPLELDARRSLALVLTGALIAASPRERAEWTSVRFIESDPASCAQAGMLAIDEPIRGVEVDVRAQRLGRRARNRFVAGTLASLADAYGLDLDVESDRRALVIAFASVRADRDVTRGGRFLSEYEPRLARVSGAIAAIVPATAIALTGMLFLASLCIAILAATVALSATIAALVATFFTKKP